MDLYTATSYELAERLTKRYSTSFSLSSLLFDKAIRPDIYAIYGLVRIADEIVDAYDGADRSEQLDVLLDETMAAIERGYSVNPIVHAFSVTARTYAIDADLIEPFFESMAMDLHPKTYTNKLYETYIYGSAEVVGLMCLRVFVAGDSAQYERLTASARALGSAYQKVNFLRDMKADFEQLGRVYFPGIDYERFDDAQKAAIIADIEAEYRAALDGMKDLPANSRRAVMASYYYYSALLAQLKVVSADEVKQRRVRVATVHKLYLLVKAWMGR